MRYEGPIYRPPSEANSLLIQATVGCPHNLCTFCMVYKNGPKFRIRPVEEIKKDLDDAKEVYGTGVSTLFFPSGNTIIMKTEELAEICRYAREIFPKLERITVYGSSQYIYRKGLKGMKILADAGLSRIHVGLETGDDEILKRIKKGTNSKEQVQAGLWTKEAGIELSEYVVLGIGGKERTKEHIDETVNVLNQIDPDFIRLRTFMPKINTPLLEDVEAGRFKVLGPHGILKETHRLIKGLKVTSSIVSDHYTNYIRIGGQMPERKRHMLRGIKAAMERPASSFRAFRVGME